MLEALALLVLAAGTTLWIDSLRAREAALAAGRAACERYGVLLLDDTVAVTRMRFARNAEGRLRLARTYGFEFSDTGNNRRHGVISMVGSQAEDVSLEPYPEAEGEDFPRGEGLPQGLDRPSHLTRIK